MICRHAQSFNYPLCQTNLRSIYEYYKSVAGIDVAEKIKQEIKSSLIKLKDENVNWQEDEFLNSMGRGHRRDICGNYKIIYYRDLQKEITYVTDIFDSRQDPINQKG
jgi:plasmid stabilization system protein ParE